MNKKSIVLIISIIIILLFLGYLNSYVGYYGYNKDTIRRYSKSLSESKERETFIKEVNFLVEPDTLEIKEVFIEKGFYWGSSSEETRFLNENDTIESNQANLQYQVVGTYDKVQENGEMAVFSGGDYNKYSPHIPIVKTEINDTLTFKVILNNKYSGVIKVW